MSFTGFGGGRGSINSGSQNMASGNPSSANYGGGGKSNSSTSGNGGKNTGGNLSSNNTSKAKTSDSAKSSATKSSSTSTGGGIMGGLTSAVQSARAARSTTSTTGKSSMSSNIGNAVANAFGGKDQSSNSMGTGASGYSNDTAGSVSNSVGAMNTPQAKAKAESQMNAFKSGYRDQTNNSMTSAAFGTAGTVGSAIGAGIGKVTGTNYAAGSDEANTAARGAAYANQNGLSSTARGLGSMAAGILGGPVGSAIASLALGGVSYGMQRNAFPSAFEGQQDKGITSSMAMNNGSETMREGGNQLGGIAASMQQAAQPEPVAAAQPAQQEPNFEHAGDYTNQRNSLWNLNLGSII